MAHWQIDCGDGTVYEVPRNRANFDACPPVKHTYTAAGTYTVTLTAVEPDGSPYPGSDGVASTTVTVTAPPPPPPPVKTPALIDFGGYTSGYSFPNYLTSG